MRFQDIPSASWPDICRVINSKSTHHLPFPPFSHFLLSSCIRCRMLFPLLSSDALVFLICSLHRICLTLPPSFELLQPFPFFISITIYWVLLQTNQSCCHSFPCMVAVCRITQLQLHQTFLPLLLFTDFFPLTMFC